MILIASLGLALAGCTSAPDINGMISGVFSSPAPPPPPPTAALPPPDFAPPPPPKPVASKRTAKKCKAGERLAKGKCIRAAPTPT
jgi:hypothetical protein